MSVVLVVEDEPDVRLLTRLLLELAGHEVLEAPDGETALNLVARAEAVDIVLLDLQMPGISGWDVLARLRQDGALDRLSVVIFSAHIEPREYARAIAEGAKAYLTKPFTEAQLLAALRTGVG